MIFVHDEGVVDAVVVPVTGAVMRPRIVVDGDFIGEGSAASQTEGSHDGSTGKNSR